MCIVFIAKIGWHCLYSPFHLQVIWLINETFCITSFNSECFSVQQKEKIFFLQSLKDCFVNVTKNRRERNLWVFIYQNHNFISNEWKNLHYNFSHSLSTDVRKFCAAIDYFRKNESRLYPFIIFHHSFEKTKCLTTVLLLCSNELKPHPFHFLIELQNRSHVGLLVQKTFTTTFFLLI
jgi:hypothetical protein